MLNNQLEINKVDEDFIRIKGFEKFYMISNYGRVVSLHNRKQKFLQLKMYKQHNGYLVVHLRYNYSRSKRRVHGLVAEHFIENDDPFLKIEVHHKNENKEDNYFKNLEWCTSRQNTQYYYSDGEQYENQEG